MRKQQCNTYQVLTIGARGTPPERYCCSSVSKTNEHMKARAQSFQQQQQSTEKANAAMAAAIHHKVKKKKRQKPTNMKKIPKKHDTSTPYRFTPKAVVNGSRRLAKKKNLRIPAKLCQDGRLRMKPIFESFFGTFQFSGKK